MRSRISRSLWQRFFSLLSQRPQSERFCLFHYAFANVFHIFKNSLIVLLFLLETSRCALVANALRCEIAFLATPESEDSLVAEK